jgi:hypothetical protein
MLAAGVRHRVRRVAAGFLAALVTLACGKVQEAPVPPAPGDAGADAAHLSCDDLTALALAGLNRALETNADHGCQADTDCQKIVADTRCTNGCAPLATTRAVASIQKAIAAIDDAVCSRFVGKGCQVIEPPCLMPTLLGSCVSGACESIPPSAWTELDVEQGSGPCPPGQSCNWSWSLTPDGTVTTLKAGVGGAAMLSAADLRTADAIARSESFRRSMASGFQCDPPPTDVGVRLRRRAPNTTGGYEETSQDVTGCAISGPKGNDAERLFALVRKY